MSIGLTLYDRLPLIELSALSASGLDRPLAHDAELVVASLAGEGTVYGATQRACDAPAAPGERWSRSSGGHAVRAGEGTLYVGLALARPGALVACEPPRLFNRYVRPVLKALGRSGALAHYFDRDWISVGHRPVAALGLAHDAGSQRALVEVFVALTRPFAVDPTGATFAGKAPATVVEAAGREIPARALSEGIAAAFGEAFGHAVVPHEPARGAPRPPPLGPEWDARAAEAIGDVTAGHDDEGALRIGGAWMASRDAIAGLEADLAASVDDEGDARAIDARLTAPGVVTFGVRSLASVLTAVRGARAARPDQRKPA